MKRLLSILLSVDERMAILDSYVNDSLSKIVAKRMAGGVCNVFHSTDVSATRKVRNGCTVMSEIAVQSINRVCTQVEIDINTGVFILRTVDLTVCIC